MLEKLSPDFILRLYNLLLSGNANIYFHCARLRNADRESATNSPISFGLKLLQINCKDRLPLSGRKKEAYLGEEPLFAKLHRPAVHEFMSTALTAKRAYTDVLGSLIIPRIEKTQFYQLIENQLSIDGFAVCRKQLDHAKHSIDLIYAGISKRLGRKITPQTELSLFERCCYANPYMLRAMEMLSYNHVPVTGIIQTSYSAAFMQTVLQNCGFDLQTVQTTGDTGKSVAQLLKDEAKETKAIALGSAFRHFLKPAARRGNDLYFYTPDRFVTQKIDFPELTQPFRFIYLHLIGTHLLNTQRGEHFVYELSFCCLAPFVFAQMVALKQMGKPLCYTGDIDDFLPLLAIEQFDMRLSDPPADVEIGSHFETCLKPYSGVFETLCDQNDPELCVAVQNGVLDYCRQFFSFAGDCIPSESQLRENAQRLLNAGARRMIGLLAKEATA